ncbi:TPA: integrase core domain-containing protein, partial [Aeromonas veronii]
MVREAVDIYNAERPHHALKYRTPDAVHRGVLSREMLVENV